MVSGHAKIDISMLQDTSGSRLKCTVCGEEFEGATAADANRLFAELHHAGILTDDEFAAKKAEILDRM